MALAPQTTVACDINTLNRGSNAPCFDCHGELQKQAVMVYLLSVTLAALQGVTPQTPNALRAAVQLIAASRPENVCDQMDVAVAYNGAMAAGAAQVTQGQSVAVITNAAKQFRNMSLTDLRAIEIFLRCQLNAWF
jgi:hypothetical protein